MDAAPNPSPDMPAGPVTRELGRAHLTRLMQIWRSAGWPCQDAIEIDLLAAGWVCWQTAPSGHQTLRLTDAAVALLAETRQRRQRVWGAHDRLSARIATQLTKAGRIVWLELPLRAAVPWPEAGQGAASDAAADAPMRVAESVPMGQLWPDDPEAIDGPPAHVAGGMAGPEGARRRRQARIHWRMARPDVFSVRHTSVRAYLHPMVHEIKVSRADLLSDLRHEAKRAAYQWLCSECYYVFPAGIAEPDEIPAEFGVWVVHGDVAEGRLELLRPAQHQPCELPFDVWMALARATPIVADPAGVQGLLHDEVDGQDTTEAPTAGDAGAGAGLP
jgi:hypothetical protein